MTAVLIINVANGYSRLIVVVNRSDVAYSAVVKTEVYNGTIRKTRVLMKNYRALEAKYFLQVSFPRASFLQLYPFPSDNLVNFIDQSFFVAFDFPNQNCALGLFFKLLLFN